MPLYPQSAMSWGAHPTPSTSVVFAFGLAFESFKECGGALDFAAKYAHDNTLCTTTFNNLQNDAWAPLCKILSLSLHLTITHHASIMKCTNAQLSAKKYVHLLHKLHYVK
jgi:hypothetical protein